MIRTWLVVALLLNGCAGVGVAAGAAGSAYTHDKIEKLEKRIEELEKKGKEQ